VDGEILLFYIRQSKILHFFPPTTIYRLYRLLYAMCMFGFGSLFAAAACMKCTLLTYVKANVMS
jgi:hypothetical protein